MRKNAGSSGYCEKQFACGLEIYDIKANEYYDKKRENPHLSADEILLQLLLSKEKNPNSFIVLYQIQIKLREMCISKGENASAMQHTIYAAYYTVCTDIGIELNFLEFNSNESNRLYVLREFYKDEMIDNCMSIPLPYNHYPPDIDAFRNAVKHTIRMLALP